AYLLLVDPDTDGAAGARRFQLRHGRQCLVERALQHLLVPIAMCLATDIVKEQDVDRAPPKPPQARLERAHHAVARVVEYCAPTTHGEPVGRLALRARDYQPPH